MCAARAVTRFWCPLAVGLNEAGDSEEIRVYYGGDDAVREVAVDVETQQLTNTDLELCD